MQNPGRFCPGGPFAEAEDCICARVDRLTDAIRDLVHVNFSSCLNVLVAHDRLGVLHGSVLLKVSSEGASENLKSAQIPRDAKLIGDWPHLPLEEILGSEGNRFALIPSMSARWEHQSIWRSVRTDFSPGLDVGADELRNWNSSTAVFCFHLPYI